MSPRDGLDAIAKRKNLSSAVTRTPIPQSDFHSAFCTPTALCSLLASSDTI